MEGAYGKGKYCPPGKDEVPRPRRPLEDHGEEPRPDGAARRLARLARDRAADAQGLRALRRAGQQGRARARLRRHGRHVALQVRHAARRLRRRSSTASGSRCKPLYVSLHAYVRWKLREKYGAARGPRERARSRRTCSATCGRSSGTTSIPLVAPKDADPGFDLTELLKARKTDALADGALRRGLLHLARLRAAAQDLLGALAVHQAARPRGGLPRQRLGRRQRRRPAHQDVHRASPTRTSRRSTTSSGHNFYQRAYNTQPFLFRDSANDGFHEAIGDTIALSITPEYLVKLGLLDKAPDPSKDIGLLLQKALDKVAFLPFGLLIDQWRWKVFSGEDHAGRATTQAWWELRAEVPGRRAARRRAARRTSTPARSTTSPANVPYTRYFLADILQFQFHRALCEGRRLQGPAATAARSTATRRPGERLNAMLAMGAEPAVARGARGADRASARWTRPRSCDYFAPLQKWLDEQNKGKPVGW